MAQVDEWGFGLENKPKAAQEGSPKCPECREVAGWRHPQLGYWICQACYAISDDRGRELKSADVSRMVRARYGGTGYASHKDPVEVEEADESME